jgi:hypothetical protein
MTGMSDIEFRGRWRMAACHVPGSGHIARDIPCQDRAGTWLAPRPALVIMDGRGSAKLSQLGAAAALVRLKQAIRTGDPQFARVLDAPGAGLAGVGWQSLSLMLYHIAASEQNSLAEWYGSSPAEFEFTLTVAVVGKHHIGWLAIGDSPLVICRHGIAGLVTPPEPVEFANQTTFVCANPRGSLGMKGGIIPVAGVDSLVAMTDGSASRLVDLQRHVPAPATEQVARHLGSGEWRTKEVRDMLSAVEWDRVTRDDRSVAILTSKRPTGPPSPSLGAGHSPPTVGSKPKPLGAGRSAGGSSRGEEVGVTTNENESRHSDASDSADLSERDRCRTTQERPPAPADIPGHPMHIHKPARAL